MKTFTSIIFLFSVLLLSGCKSNKPVEYEDVVVGYSGEARMNPFLAAQKLLERNDKSIEFKTIAKYNIHDYSAIVVPAAAISTDSAVRKASHFLDDGGHLVILMEYGTKGYNDFSGYTNFSSFYEEPQERLESLISDYGIQLKRENPFDIQWETNDVEMHKKAQTTYAINDSSSLEVETDEYTYQLHGGGNYSFNILESQLSDAQVSHYQTDKLEAHKVVSAENIHGGKLTLIADARMFRNPHLGLDDHAPFLMELFVADSVILFTSGRNESFYELVIKYYPYALAGILLCVVLWLLSKYQRFGPVIEFHVKHPVNYLSSIIAGAHFQWKRGNSEYLLDPLRNKAIRLTGGENASSENLAQVSEEMDLTTEEIDRALQSKNIDQPDEITKTVIILQKIVRYYERES